MAPIDPHTYTDSTHPLTTHISLSFYFYFDFPSSTISSSSLLSLSAPHSGPLTLDTRSLSISAAIDPDPLLPLPFPGPHPRPIPHPHPLKPINPPPPLQNGAVRLRPAVAPAASDAQRVPPVRLHPVPGRPRAVHLPLPGHAGRADQVYSEDVPEVLDAAAREFAETEEMIEVGEGLFGPYEWERFHTCIAHELAHSWTGNLITNKSNDHAWLNEGFTTYAERRIVEVVQGKERANLNIGIGVDPDDISSRVPYEKGFQFLWRIERGSINTDMFLDFLKANIPGIEDQIDLNVWTEGTGIPPDAMEPVSDIYTNIVSLANEFKSGRIPNEDEVAQWGGQEWELCLENLPKSVEAPQLVALDKRYRLAESRDYEVKVAFLQRAVVSRCTSYYNEVEKTLKEVGRMKYLRPLYTALVQGAGRDGEKMFTRRIFSEACVGYHPI
ncbi:hypothetical protein SASPL_139180 [Salvia splendens]|uniref:Peptidase M1 leukotriene A4 hydrolase/aminopeptidase C-terminal domain-containing protein n=1 Tax=Salvia splendens TaxID=180675 RepID=A0A8X8ZEY7_SALSN|nr:hypothetical protein SASPL_139180 [Salvia splendens]